MRSMLIRLCQTSLLLILAPFVFAHHDSEPETGPNAMLQHMESGEEYVMELVMPHRMASGNQLMLNFFETESGDTAEPEQVNAALNPAEGETENELVPLDKNGPTYSGPTAGVTEPGEWLVQVEAQMPSGDTVHFEVPVTLH